MSPQALSPVLLYPGCMKQSGYLHCVVKKKTWICMEEDNFQESSKMRKQCQKTSQLFCSAQDTGIKPI